MEGRERKMKIRADKLEPYNEVLRRQTEATVKASLIYPFSK